ncbi:MAG: outer membrane protein assembly factor BamB family protein [Planctomycetota bacterium]|jgi:outer membrane protein assembly factor BamB
MTRSGTGSVLLLLVGGLAAAFSADGQAQDVAPQGTPDKDFIEVVVPAKLQKGAARFESGDLQGFIAQVGQGKILTPAVDNQRVIAGSGNSMKAFDALTGRRLWSSATDDGGPTSPALLGGRVTFNTASCTLYSLDAKTGRRQWSYWIAGSVVTTPTASGDLVFVTGPDDKSGGVKIEALDAKTGKLRFTRRVSREILSAPVVRDGRVFCTMTDGSVMALDFKGKVLWHRSLQALSAPWPDGKRLLIARGDPKNPALANIDARTGDGGRAVATPPAVPTNPRKGMVRGGGANRRGVGRGAAPRPGLDREPGAPGGNGAGNGTPGNPGNPGAPPATPVPPVPAVGGQRVGVGGFGYEGPRPCVSRRRVAMAAGNTMRVSSLDGAQKWSESLGERQRAVGSVVAAGDLFLVATLGGELHGYDVETLERTFRMRFKFEGGAPMVLTSSPSVHRGRAYLGTANGLVLGIDLPDASADGWPMWGGGPERAK